MKESDFRSVLRSAGEWRAIFAKNLAGLGAGPLSRQLATPKKTRTLSLRWVVTGMDFDREAGSS